MTERDLHLRGDILIENGRIAAIGTIDGDADEVIDGSKMIALPSFVNAHTHSPMVLMRNYKDTCEELMSWLSEIFPIEDKLQDEDIYWGSKLAIAEMIQSGCTTFADMYFQSWNTARAVRETGVRAVLGLTLFGDGEETKRRFREFVPRIEEAMDGSDMIRLDAAPHAIYTCTADTYRLAVEWTKERGHYLSTHLSETMTEVNDSLKNNGMRPAEYLDSLGVFSVPCYLAHCVHLSDSEAGMLASHERISIVHNPASFLTEAGIAAVSLACCILQFQAGKSIGRKYNAATTAGQALGQKNTVLAIWIGYTFMTPVTSVAGGFYCIWHNAYNSWQLYRKGKAGGSLS